MLKRYGKRSMEKGRRYKLRRAKRTRTYKTLLSMTGKPRNVVSGYEKAKKGLVEMLKTSEFPVRVSHVYSHGFNIDSWFDACASSLEELAESLLGGEIKGEKALKVAEVLGWEKVLRILPRELAKKLGLVWYEVSESMDLEGLNTTNRLRTTARFLMRMKELFTDEDQRKIETIVNRLLEMSEGKVRWEKILRLPEVE
jgi:hypothetical protein